MKQQKEMVAYFSMEIALNNEIPNYAGGLGVLAADTLLSCADRGMNVVGVSLIYHLNDIPQNGFNPARFLKRRDEFVTIDIENRKVKLDIWQLDIKGTKGTVPILFLSSNSPINAEWDRNLTRYLYAADGYTRLCQEAILGIGGARALEATGHKDISFYHMNEGHSVPLVLELLRKNDYDYEKVKESCAFTSHTPIPAGHDYFDYNLAYKILGKMLPPEIKEYATQDRLGMTELALNLSKRFNSVSQRHNQVCKEMFPGYNFENVTNGVYHPRWAGKSMKKLFDKHLGDWLAKPELFAKAEKIPSDKVEEAHKEQKRDLISWINSKPELLPFEKITKDDLFSEDTLTIGFARRFVPYKRHTLIFRNLDKLREISHKKLQLVFAGTCHQRDEFCNNIIAEINHFSSEMRGQVKVVVLKKYDLDIAKKMVAGCDVWLNNPISPREASGTSGMKAALNGVLNLSILDGWWIEGYKMNPKSGWAFGRRYLGESTQMGTQNRDNDDSEALLKNLEDVIDCYYNRPDEWTDKMKNAISLLAHFNSHRLTDEYKKKMWS